ncbi:hypothetical protein AGMMS49546_11450 [Spirochaetia bacterium]|nr:hypothetical protein AGMMS49546_11450 [Spirochaetia bacterium]
MATVKQDIIETLQKDFSALTEENKKNIIEMTKFLVITQNKVLPSMLEQEDEPDDNQA